MTTSRVSFVSKTLSVLFVLLLYSIIIILSIIKRGLERAAGEVMIVMKTRVMRVMRMKDVSSLLESSVQKKSKNHPFCISLFSSFFLSLRCVFALLCVRKKKIQNSCFSSLFCKKESSRLFLKTFSLRMKSVFLFFRRRRTF